MALRSLSAMPWIGETLDFDLANTVVIGAGHSGTDIDFFDDPILTLRWTEKAGHGAFGLLPMEQILALRRLIRSAFHAASNGQTLSDEVLLELNNLAAQAPHIVALDSTGECEWIPVGGDISANAAAEAIGHLSGSQAENLHRCRAPSCGMFYLATRPDQRWCTSTCGSRARAARRNQNLDQGI
ncbi:MAG: ABATE domain-containing protein [Rhodoglobus sp.]